jgi:hypothetical protein
LVLAAGLLAVGCDGGGGATTGAGGVGPGGSGGGGGQGGAPDASANGGRADTGGGGTRDDAGPDLRVTADARADATLPPTDALRPPADASAPPADVSADVRPLPDVTHPADARAPVDGPTSADLGPEADAAPPPADAAPGDPDAADAQAPDALVICVPRPEVCNRRDDNCDGRIDERLNCELYVSCRDLYSTNNLAPNDVYPVRGPIADQAVDVYCDMETDGGGWTLVGASARQPLDDVGVDWYPELTSLAPAGPTPGIWGELADRFPAWDLRFACRDTLAEADAPFTVDVSFYGTDWYAEIARGDLDAATCFQDGNVPRPDRVPPARRNNLTGELIPRGTPFGGGVLEGEDTCDDEGDFAVDFNDRGMDGDPNDGTDWGEDDFTGRCGHDGVLDGQWFVFARERTDRETVPLRVNTRIGVIGNEALATGLQAFLLQAEFLPDGADLPDRLFQGQFDVVVISRVLRGGVRVTPALVDALDRFVREGGGLITELDGALPFLSGYAPGFAPPPGAPTPAGWFHAEMTGTGRVGPNTPVAPVDPIDFLFRGIPNGLTDPVGTENFFGLAAPAGRDLDLRVAATFPAGPPIVPAFGAAPAVLRGNHCGHPVLFVNFDWGDALANPASLVRDFAANLVQEASFLPAFDVPVTCPVYVPPPERTQIMVCGAADRDPAALMPAHFALSRVEGCRPDARTQALFVTSRADLAQLDAVSLRAWVQAGGRVISAGGRGRGVYDVLFGTRSGAGVAQGDCGGEPMPAVRANAADRFWNDVPFAPPAATGCGEDLSDLVDLVAVGGWAAGTVSLGFRDLGRGRFWGVEADFTAAGPALSESGRDLLRYLALGRYQGVSFSGVRLGVPEAELLEGGFTPCLISNYGSYEPVADLAAQCDGDVLVMGCRPAGEPDLQVAAMGLRDEVFLDVGPAGDAAHAHNGALWYFDPASAWGFAPDDGTGVDRFPCDVLNPRAPDRLCWNIAAGELNPGYRCGATTAFDVSWERVIYQRNGPL